MKSSLDENTVTSLSMAALITSWVSTELLPKVRTHSLVSGQPHRKQSSWLQTIFFWLLSIQDASKWHFRGMLNVASFIPIVRFAIQKYSVISWYFIVALLETRCPYWQIKNRKLRSEKIIMHDPGSHMHI